MRRLLILVFLCCMQGKAVQAQSASAFVGSWEGIINVGSGLRIVFHVKSTGNNSFSSLADSPDQKSYGLFCDTTIIEGSHIKIEMRTVSASYSGQLTNDSTIDGEFTQGASLPLQLVKGREPVRVAARVRKQTPIPPFP